MILKRNRGFTGTRNPPMHARGIIQDHLITLNPEVDVLVVGCCIGVDEIIGVEGHRMGFSIHGVLPSNRSLVSISWRAWCDEYELMPPHSSYIGRNDRI